MPRTGVVYGNIFKTHYEIGRDKDLCIETCFLKTDKYTLLIFKKGISCTDKLHIKWIRLNKEGKRSTCKTSASTLRAGEFKISQSGTCILILKRWVVDTTKILAEQKINQSLDT